MRPVLCLLCTLTTLVASEAVSVTAGSLGGQPVLLVRAPAGERLDPAVAARLLLPVSVSWQDLDVATACDRLARLTGAPIVVAPELRTEGAAPITLAVSDMRADRVLDWVRTLGRVQVTPMNGGLYVSRQAPVRAERLSVIPVGDLVHPVRDFPGPELAVPAPGGEGARILPARAAPAPRRMDADELAELLEEHLAR